jgi:hypothetical protein
MRYHQPIPILGDIAAIPPQVTGFQNAIGTATIPAHLASARPDIGNFYAFIDHFAWVR